MDRISGPRGVLLRYRVHILVFLITVFFLLTFAHPAILLTDEWITTSQLSQINEGHQFLIYETKYGVYENGTPTEYFSVHKNILCYSLIYPLVSLPAEKLVVFFGNDFIFFIVYLWTFLLIGLALVLKELFPDFCQEDTWHLRTGIVTISFIGFFLNLLWYKPINLSGNTSYPEIVAIVFTNILIVGFLAVIIYEVMVTICDNPAYSLFGTVVCLSCSSYLFWTSFCKDHLIVALLFSAIILMIMKFLVKEKPGYFAGSFIIAGLLAWARPELGAFVFIALCAIMVPLLWNKRWSDHKQYFLNLLVSPFFVLLGALPFFVNNYLATRNIFLPAYLLIPKSVPMSPDSGGIQSVSYDYSMESMNVLLKFANLSNFPSPVLLFSDIFGFLFYPLSGGMGVLPLVPVFILAVLVLPIIIKKNNPLFSDREKVIVLSLILLSLAIFGAYINRTHIMNIDLGIMPDIRYLSPVYLPLTIIGLMIFRKIPELTDKPLNLLKYTVATWIVLIPLSSLLIFEYYPDPLEWKFIFSLFDLIATTCILGTVLVFGIFFYYSLLTQWRTPVQNIVKIIFALACSLPLVWQAGASLLSAMYANGFEGYSFWLPALYQLFVFMM